ncbi:hypothetical protein LIER_19873 [Lithospermum erythrorhizon]|uniref:CRAL-TRIO domain-containing protein n=1 Tax=Lithospermum erythrorhizon TaxID=34254 RepID=A0AAV3QKW7_LITER
MNSQTSSSSSMLTMSEEENLIEKHEIIKIQGTDKQGHPVLRIIGKFFPAKLVTLETVKKYLEEKIYPNLIEKPFSVVYVHTEVNRGENFPGFSALKSIYDSIPVNVKENMEALYFLHPALQSRLFLATFGRILFSGRLYGKLRYVNRLEFLWDNIKRNEIEMPEFVFEHDEDLEYRPVLDYGMESDHPRIYNDAPLVDYPVSMYSMRCIA